MELLAFIYNSDTVRAICAKASLPEPINISFLNEYDCMLEFSTEFELHKIAMNLQQIMQWIGYDVIITCEVVTKDRLHEIGWGGRNLICLLVKMLQGNILKLPLTLFNKLNKR